MLLDALAMVENQTGACDAARAHALAALAINERTGSIEQRMYNYYNIGESDRLTGRPAAARGWLERCAALARDIDFEQFLAYALAALAECDLQLGQHAAAVAGAREGRRVAAALDDPTAGGLAAVVLARAALAKNDEAAARDELLGALGTALRWSDGLVLVAALPVAARWLRHRGREVEACRCLRWLAARPQLSAAAAREALVLLGSDGGGQVDEVQPAQLDDPAPLAREIEVALAADGSRGTRCDEGS